MPNVDKGSISNPMKLMPRSSLVNRSSVTLIGQQEASDKSPMIPLDREPVTASPAQNRHTSKLSSVKTGDEASHPKSQADNPTPKAISVLGLDHPFKSEKHGDKTPAKKAQVSQVAFPSSDDLEATGDIKLDLHPIFDQYERLHAALCYGDISRIPAAAKSFIEHLFCAVETLEKAFSDILATSVYDSARRGLLFSRELLESHYDKLQSGVDGTARHDALMTGYQLMEMTMFNFRSLLQVVEKERVYNESFPDLSDPAESNRKEGTTNRNTPNEKLKGPKQTIFARLRRISQACKGILDASSSKQAPLEALHKRPADSSLTLVDDPFSCDDESETRGHKGSLDIETGKGNTIVANEVLRDSDPCMASNIRASLAIFPDASPRLTRLNLPSRCEDDTDVVRGKDGIVAAATLPELVRILTDQREVLEHDMTDLVDAFFLFFRSFVSPSILFDMLVDRFGEQPPVALTEEQVPVWRLYHRFGKIHVAKLLAVWLESHWKDETDKDVLDRMIKFTYSTIAKDSDLPPDTAKLVANGLLDCSSGSTGHYGRWLEKEVKKTEEAGKRYPETVFHTRLKHLETLRSDDLSMVDIGYFRKDGGAEELARQLTVIEAELFHAFLPEELIHFDDPAFQTKLEKWKTFSNALSLWVPSSILDHHDIAFRAELIEMFISLAMICKNMRNYSSALAILLGLQSSSVTRLCQTEQVVSPSHRELRNQLEEFFNVRTNWRQYRVELPQNLPAVPLAVVIIKDVKQNREALPRVKSVVRPPSQPVQEKIYLQYYRNMRRTVRDLEKCYGSYKLQPIDFIYRWLKHNVSIFESKKYDEYTKTLHEKSRAIESRAT
ncbi:hypothetical protein AcV7_009720 [Taiwanofungus camphoratus]|nr:hypothetical protein AcV7_009720 [Antrodia cinnamomea]